MLLRIVNQQVNRQIIGNYSRTVLSRSASTTGSTEKDMPEVNTQNPYEVEKTKCVLCKYNITPNYKNVRLLSQFQSQHTGMVFGRHITGLCKHKQAQVEEEIKKAQQCGFMGIWTKDLNYVEDPKLFDPFKPIRKHRF